jgi:hypothetical protein
VTFSTVYRNLTIILILFLPVTSSSQEPGRKKDVLELGQPIKRELAGGEEHLYRVKLGADQLLKVIVEHHGIDLLVRVLRPDGRQVFLFDAESRTEGKEVVSLAAEATGDYRLVVAPARKRVSFGSYQIRIEEIRLATENDRALDDARKLLEEGKKLRDAANSIRRSLYLSV